MSVGERQLNPGAGLRWEPMGLQRSGNLVFVESALLSEWPEYRTGPPYIGVVVDPVTGDVLARFPIGNRETAAKGADYDDSGTWMIVLLADDTVEIQGRGQRITLPLDAMATPFVVRW
jgi:hypothetical protein